MQCGEMSRKLHFLKDQISEAGLSSDCLVIQPHDTELNKLEVCIFITYLLLMNLTSFYSSTSVGFVFIWTDERKLLLHLGLRKRNELFLCLVDFTVSRMLK